MAQLELPGLDLPEPPVHHGPVAVVRLDVPAAHLDREYDYAIPEKLVHKAVVGAPITAQFGARTTNGYIVDITETTSHPGRLRALRSVVTSLPVLTAETYRAAREVANYYAGSVFDVLRLAIPPRHATAEKKVLQNAASAGAISDIATPDFAHSQQLDGAAAVLGQLVGGHSPRVVWQALPGVVGTAPRWMLQLRDIIAATLTSKRRAIVVLPAQRDVQRVIDLCETIGLQAIAAGSANQPAARWRAFTLSLLGHVDVVVGTRSAVWAPQPDLGATIVVDDADQLLREQHAPRPEAWRIAAARSGATIYLSLARSPRAQLLVERGEAISVTPTRTQLKHFGARVIVGDDDAPITTRLPPRVFQVAREGLKRGPVLFVVPRAGYVKYLRCARCREQLRCAQCAGPLHASGRGALQCGWGGHQIATWQCPKCQATSWRASAIGSERTAEELGRAFHGVPVRVSGRRTGIIAEVAAKPAIVVATPGAEPIAPGGYAAGVVLDGAVLSSRTELEATDAITTQLARAWALIDADATFVLSGHLDDAVAQALIRGNFADFAARTLNERAALHLPPVATMVELIGARASLAEVAARLTSEVEAIEILGPIAVDEQTDRLYGRVPPTAATQLREAVAVEVRRRSLAGHSPLHATIDPHTL